MLFRCVWFMFVCWVCWIEAHVCVLCSTGSSGRGRLAIRLSRVKSKHLPGRINSVCKKDGCPRTPAKLLAYAATPRLGHLPSSHGKQAEPVQIKSPLLSAQHTPGRQHPSPTLVQLPCFLRTHRRVLSLLYLDRRSRVRRLV